MCFYNHTVSFLEGHLCAELCFNFDFIFFKGVIIVAFFKEITISAKYVVILIEQLLIELLSPLPAYILLIFIIGHLQFLHLTGKRLILTDYVEVVVKISPVHELKIAWIEPDYGSRLAFDFNL